MRRFLTILLIALNILICCLLLISGYGGHVNPAATPLPGLLLMTFPILLLAAILLLVVDIIAKRRLALLPAFCILFSAPAIWSFCPLNFFSYSAAEGERELKVMTYNVFQFADMQHPDATDTINGSITAILSADADIVCIQEGSMRDIAEWGRYESQSDSILSQYPYRLHDNVGMMIWSKYPLQPIELRRPDDPSSDFMGADVDIDGYRLTVISVHLQSLDLSPDDKTAYVNFTMGQPSAVENGAGADIFHKLTAAMRIRAGQALLLRSQIDSLARPNIIVAGDFNDINDCWAQRTIMGRDIRNTYTAVGFGPTISYHADRFYFNIDHILYGGDIRPLSIKRGSHRSSDHYSVTATYAIPAR